MGVVDRGFVEGLVEFDTNPGTRMTFDFEFLILALNLLSMVNFTLRLEVLMGVLLLDSLNLEFTKETWCTKNHHQRRQLRQCGSSLGHGMVSSLRLVTKGTAPLFYCSELVIKVHILSLF